MRKAKTIGVDTSFKVCYTVIKINKQIVFSMLEYDN